MKLDCILIGSKGQGTIMAAKLLAKTAESLGNTAQTWETILKGQRNGCIISHIRIGKKEKPPIPLGQGDILISTEPAEALINFDYLKPQGKIIVCSKPVMAAAYSPFSPNLDASAALGLLGKKAYQLTIVDGDNLCNLAGNLKPLSLILLGVAIAQGVLPLSREDIENTIRTNINPKLWKMTIHGLGLGIRYKALS